MQIDLLDVFAHGPLSGNPLAVVRGADHLAPGQMLALTRWLGFSETTFLLPPTDPAADYRVRIFYPAGELPFAGHPTLGSAFAWLAAGGDLRGDGTIVQECGVGLVPVRVAGEVLAFRAPPLRRDTPLTPAERRDAVQIAGVDDAQVNAAFHADNGPGWRLLHLADAAALQAACPVARAPVPSDVGLVAPADPDSGADWEVRAFFTNAAGVVIEDPVTGSLNAAVAQYLYASGLAEGTYTAAQGRSVGADGRVQVERDDDGAIWVGGVVRMVAQGGELHGGQWGSGQSGWARTA